MSKKEEGSRVSGLGSEEKNHHEEHEGHEEGNTKASMIVIDIETYRTRDEGAVARVTQDALLKQPAQNTAKELKLTWDTERARDERVSVALSKTSVDVLLAEVLCIATRSELGATTFDGMGQSEGDMLYEFVEEMDRVAGPQTIWVGHNIASFDLPILLNRMRRYGVVPPKHFPVYVNGRWQGRVFDTMKRTPCSNGLGLVSLDNTCAAYGVPLREVMWAGAPMEGSRVAEAFEAGAIETILEYCAEDVITELKLYGAMTFDFTWGTYGVGSEAAERVSEIERDETLTDTQKALAVYDVMNRAGLIPRV